MVRVSHNFQDLTGRKFNRLTVVRRIENDKSGKARWLCKCDCGNLCEVTTNGLKTGNNQSCGCLHKETFNNKKHCKRNTRLYRIYAHMKERCYSIACEDYADYGERGIKICDEWLNSFQAFYDWAIESGYQENLTINRINNDGNYEPSNCEWTTQKEQANNKRNNRIISYSGKTQTLHQWAEELKINYSTLYQRIYVRHWEVEKAFAAK